MDLAAVGPHPSLTLPNPMEVNAVRISMPVKGSTGPGALGNWGSHLQAPVFVPARAVLPQCAARVSGEAPHHPTMPRWIASLSASTGRSPTEATSEPTGHTMHPSHTHSLVTNTSHVCPSWHAMMTMAGLHPSRLLGRPRGLRFEFGT